MPRDGKEEVTLADVHTQLRIISRLIAAQLKVTTNQQEMVRLLASTGASNMEIAMTLDTTAATVATTLQRLRKKAKTQSTASHAPDAGRNPADLLSDSSSE